MTAIAKRSLSRDIKRWAHACAKDERDSMPFVCPLGSVSSGALFDRPRPGAIFSFPFRASFNFAA